jgi:zinc protease
LGRTLAWDETFETQVGALTNEPIQGAMKKFIDPKKISIVQAGDFEKAKKNAAEPAPATAPAAK